MSRRSDQKLDALVEMVTRIESALVVRDPGNARSAEAYEGLRRTIVATGSDRRRHLAHLVAFAEALDGGVPPEDIRRMVDQWCQEEGLARSSDVDRPELYRLVGSDDGDLVVVEQAWVDTRVEGRPALVRQGQATRSGTRDAGAAS